MNPTSGDTVTSGVRDLTHVPLGDLIRQREAAARKAMESTDTGEFNSCLG